MQQSWKAKIEELKKLLKQVSDAYGGDDEDWLNEYIEEVVKLNLNTIDDAIDCFNGVLKGSPRSFTESIVLPVKTYVCSVCGYVKPFCYFADNKICSNINQNVPRETYGVKDDNKTTKDDIDRKPGTESTREMDKNTENL